MAWSKSDVVRKTAVEMILCVHVLYAVRLVCVLLTHYDVSVNGRSLFKMSYEHTALNTTPHQSFQVSCELLNWNWV
jgi:hypothetical protein